jgi:hypothetical protein
MGGAINKVVNCKHNRGMSCYHPEKSRFLGIFRRNCDYTSRFMFNYRCEFMEEIPRPPPPFGSRPQPKPRPKTFPALGIRELDI